MTRLVLICVVCLFAFAVIVAEEYRRDRRSPYERVKAGRSRRFGRCRACGGDVERHRLTRVWVHADSNVFCGHLRWTTRVRDLL